MDDKNAIQTTMSSLINDVRGIVESGLKKAYQNVNAITVFTYWQVGKRVAKGYTPRDLRAYGQFYLCFNDLEILYSRVPNLTWTHFRTLLSVASDDARYWYVKEASREMWSVRTLARNVGSQYYHRLLHLKSNAEA